ncbi:hypothetical protein D3C78_1058250 [compost metagenome]
MAPLRRKASFDFTCNGKTPAHTACRTGDARPLHHQHLHALLRADEGGILRHGRRVANHPVPVFRRLRLHVALAWRNLRQPGTATGSDSRLGGVRAGIRRRRCRNSHRADLCLPRIARRLRWSRHCDRPSGDSGPVRRRSSPASICTGDHVVRAGTSYRADRRWLASGPRRLARKLRILGNVQHYIAGPGDCFPSRNTPAVETTFIFRPRFADWLSAGVG